MFDMTRLLQDVVQRISMGERVSVRKEYQEEVREELEKHKIDYCTLEESDGAEKLLFWKK
jgi:nicotinamide riboside kinase